MLQRFALALAFHLLGACASAPMPALQAPTSALQAPTSALQDGGTTAAQAPEARAQARPRDTSLTSLDLHVGTQTLDNEFYWDPIEELDAFSLWYVHQEHGAWLGWESGLSISGGAETVSVSGSPAEFSGDLWEWTLGLHKSFLSRDAFLRPYLGAGFSLLIASAELDAGALGNANDGDLALGFYARAGLPLVIARRLRLGVEARVLAGADVDIAGALGDVDHTELTAFLGFAW